MPQTAVNDDEGIYLHGNAFGTRRGSAVALEHYYPVGGTFFDVTVKVAHIIIVSGLTCSRISGESFIHARLFSFR